MRKINHDEFYETYDVAKPFRFIQMRVPYVSFKIGELFISSREECKELYEKQVEEITCAKDVANWIRDTYARAKKEHGMLYAKACLTVMMSAKYSCRGMCLPALGTCMGNWKKVKHIMKRKECLTVTYVNAFDPLKKESAVVFGRN